MLSSTDKIPSQRANIRTAWTKAKLKMAKTILRKRRNARLSRLVKFATGPTTAGFICIPVVCKDFLTSQIGRQPMGIGTQAENPSANTNKHVLFRPCRSYIGPYMTIQEHEILENEVRSFVEECDQLQVRRLRGCFNVSSSVSHCRASNSLATLQHSEASLMLL